MRVRSGSPQPQAAGGPAAEGDNGSNQTLQHLYLQTFISRRIMSLAMSSILYTECCALCGLEDDGNFDEWLGNLTEPLSLCGLEFKHGKDQESGQDYLALCNSVEDESSKLATEFKPEEIAFFRCVVEKIMTAPRMAYSVGVTEALRCVSNPEVTPQISKTVAEGLLASLAAKGWLKHHAGSNRLTLSTRSNMELQSYLSKLYSPGEGDEDMIANERAYVECERCFGIVTCGWACVNEACTVRLHSYCTTPALGTKGKCPGGETGCDQIWPSINRSFTGVPIGQLVVNGGYEQEEEEDLPDLSATATQTNGKRGRTSTGKAAKPKGKGKGKEANVGSDEEEELDDEEEEEEEDEFEGDDDEEDAVAPRNGAKQKKSRFIVDEADGEDEDLYE